MEREWDLAAAGRFMPHVTLKGFFRTEASSDELVRRLSAALSGHPPVVLHNGGVIAFDEDAIVLGVHAQR